MGVYHTELIVDEGGHAVLVALTQPHLDAFIAGDDKSAARSKWSRDLPFTEELDDSGNATGNYLWKFKQNAKVVREGKPDITFSITLLDAQTKPMNANVRGGSVAKIKFAISPYAMNTSKAYGLSLKPSVVQIIKLVEGGSGDTQGFDVEEGYTASASSIGADAEFAEEDSDF
jgi:hypothetical protein